MTTGSPSIAQELASLLIAPGRAQPPLLRQGVVASLDAPGQLTVYLSGDDYPIYGVRFLDSYAPVPNDAVWLLKNGPDMLVLGKVETAARWGPLQPHNVAWGRIKAASTTGTAWATLAQVQVTLADIPLKAGRIYGLRMQLRWRTDTAGMIANLDLQRDIGQTGTWVSQRVVPSTASVVTGSTNSEAVEWTETFTAAADGVDAWRLVVTRATGAGTGTPTLAWLGVYDEGPLTPIT